MFNDTYQVIICVGYIYLFCVLKFDAWARGISLGLMGVVFPTPDTFLPHTL